MSAGTESRIELKVGVLIVVCLALLVAFLLLLGDWRFGEEASVFVDWETSAGLKVGAPVRVAGMEAGRVESIEFKGGEVDDEVGRRVYIRVKLSLKPSLRGALREDADFFITTQGLLGEKYVEIDPGRSDEPLNDLPIEGVPPMRLEKMTANINRLMASVEQLIGENSDAIAGTINDVRTSVKTAKGAVEDARVFIAEAREALKQVREKGTTVLDTANVALREYTPGTGETGDNIKAITQSGKHLVASVDEAVGDGSEVRAVISDARATAARARKLMDTIGGRAESLTRKAESVLSSADQLMTDGKGGLLSALDKVNLVLDDVKVISKQLRDGEGTIGALLHDREMFDDAREIMKDLKRHPWKFLWKE